MLHRFGIRHIIKITISITAKRGKNVVTYFEKRALLKITFHLKKSCLKTLKGQPWLEELQKLVTFDYYLKHVEMLIDSKVWEFQL